MSTESTAPATEKTPKLASFGSTEIAVAVAVMAALFGGVGLGYSTITSTNADMATKGASFEKVLNMSSAELEGKTVAELNGYRQDIKRAANYSLAFGNITGYDEDVVVHELNQVNELILKKTEH